MRVTEVKVFPVTDEKLKAFVSVVLDECFMVNDIKVIEGRDGRFISMPSRRKRNGKFKDIAHPLNSQTRQMLEHEILGEYERVLNGEEPAERPKRRRRRSEAAPAVVAEPREPKPEPEPETTVVAPVDDDSSLEEVTERHLSDTFWTS